MYYFFEIINILILRIFECFVYSEDDFEGKKIDCEDRLIE